MRTLVLNATYEPLGVTTWQRAVILVIDGTAEVLELSGRQVRASTLQLEAPSVVRLNRCIRVDRTQRTPFSRHAVLRRDGHRCGYCNRYANTIDHVMPRSRGGKNVWENVVAACGPCNHRKASRTPKEARMTLIVVPKEPPPRLKFSAFSGKADPTWAPWLGSN
jgi:5-methylcytosine-specific restriction endonuclease McrA